MSMPAQSARRPMPAPFGNYEIGAAYDEMFRANGRPRPHYENLYTQLLNLPPEELHRSKQEADLSFFNQGITFTVYGRAEGTEQIFPHDLLPRIITSSEWAIIERGLTQRITALNLFLADIYHERRILKDRRDPRRNYLYLQTFPQADARGQGSARRLCQRRRDRPDSSAGRPVRGSGR